MTLEKGGRLSAPNVCPSCGTGNDPSNMFCTNCGKALQPSMPPQPHPPSAGAATPPLYPYGSPPSVGYPGPYPYLYVYAPLPKRASVSTILSGLFDVWTKNFANFFVVFLIVALVNGSIGVFVYFATFGTFAYVQGIVPDFTTLRSADIWRFIPFLIIVFVLSAILNSIILGGMTEYAVRRHRGEAASLKQSLHHGFERFLSVLGANVLLGLMVVGVIVVPLTLVIFGILGLDGSGPAIFLLYGGLLFLAVGGILALYVSIATSLYAPAIMMEDQGAIRGMTRSWQLTKGYRSALFGAILVTAFLSGVISLAISTPASLARNVFVGVAASAVVSGLIGGWSVILAAVAYDLIVRPYGAGMPPYMGPVGVPPPFGPTTPPSPPAPPPAGP